MFKITIVAGARPNFVKIAPIIHELLSRQRSGARVTWSIVHTGQHYDEKMSGSFFRQLDIPEPDVNLNCGGGTLIQQTSSILTAFEKYLMNNPTDLVLVVGDVTSTMACAMVAQFLHVPVAHVEAGIRSNDRSMPEEINRLITDVITNYYFTTSELASQNLIDSGCSKDKVFFVGNCMIDTLLANKINFMEPQIWNKLDLKLRNYMVLTLHRPGNLIDEIRLKETFNEILNSTEDFPIIFPAHPRTKKVIMRMGLESDRLHVVDPLSYLEFNYLVERCKAVITDSGGITEECTVLGIPCLTLRDNTERPETVSIGTNELIGIDPKNIAPAVRRVMSDQWKVGGIPEKWDGKTAKRIVDILLTLV
jgi:UDP-N-acetylglucosamine 2-epimerase (non-hydrolysing)